MKTLIYKLAKLIKTPKAATVSANCYSTMSATLPGSLLLSGIITATLSTGP